MIANEKHYKITLKCISFILDFFHNTLLSHEIEFRFPIMITTSIDNSL